ncbi:hypothetical protein FGO68_gene10562 [Halteria grandinella]|uniref:Uncharacterized protein n=1 Tax=Halteria grandinella TaxID=5974 RepID=A0A8J8SWY0_HALGN|nr:hypothetical protein FGO68_gene10562 [Halteria grandinella]
MDYLIKHIMQSEDQHRFTLEFKDRTLEKQFTNEVYKQDMIMARTIFILLLILASLVGVSQAILYHAGRVQLTGFITSVGLLGFGAVQNFIHLRLTYTYKRAAELYPPIQTFVMMIVGLEITMIVNSEASEMEGFGGIVAICTSLSIMFHKEFEYFLCMMLVVVYFIARSFTWFTDKMRYGRFIIIIILIFFFLHIVKRSYSRQSRQKFLSKQKQERLVQLFQNLIKLYHD